MRLFPFILSSVLVVALSAGTLVLKSGPRLQGTYTYSTDFGQHSYVPGEAPHFHASLWRFQKRDESFVPQGNHWVNFCRPSCRNVAGEKGHAG